MQRELASARLSYKSCQMAAHLLQACADFHECEA